MRRSSACWLLFLGCCGWFGITAHGYVENTDALITLHAARAWYLRGDPGLVRHDEAHLLEAGQPTWPAEHYIAGLITDPARPLYGRTGVNGKHYVWFPIGHQALLVPCVAIGEWLAARFPDAERRFEEARGGLLGAAYWSQCVASFLSPLAASGTVVLLLLLAQALGASRRQALLVVGAATLCTQFWPGSSETLSNAPGTFFLVGSALALVRAASSARPARALLVAGLAVGAAVLVRYPLVLALLPLGAWVAVTAWRAGRATHLVWLVAGGLPGLAGLLAANGLRFGDVTETGYTQNAGFGSYPLPYGLAAILFAPGKGVAWFALPSWIAIAQLFRRECCTGLAVAVLVGVALPVLVFSTVPYWAAGQCWGIRYLTGPLLLLIVVTFVCGQPWTRRPWLFGAVCGLGFVASLGGVLAPYTGQQQLAFAAARTVYGDPPNVDNNVNVDPRYSPLHSHWTYAWLALDGRIGSGRSEDTTEPLFGVRVEVAAADAAANPLELQRTDTGFRHWWPRSVPAFAVGFPAVPVSVLWLVLTLLALWLGLRSWLRGTGLTAGAADDSAVVPP